MQQTINGDCTELTAFVCEHLSVCLDNLFPGKRSTVFIILIESMNKINCFLGHCFTFFLRRLCKYPLSLLQFSCRSNEIFWNSKYSEQYFRDQESGTKVNICNFSVFEAVTNFSFIVACSLSSYQLYSWYLCHILEMVLQFLYPKYYMQQKCSPCTHLKHFSIYLLHLKRDCVGHLHRCELEKLQCFRESS